MAYSDHANHVFEIAAGLDLAAFSGIACVGTKSYIYSSTTPFSLVNFALFLALGGDGTVHEVANGIAYAAMLTRSTTGTPARIPPLCIVPCGTGNNLALNIGIQTFDESIAAALSGQVQLMDLIQMTHPEDTTAPRLEDAIDSSSPPIRVEYEAEDKKTT